jgi:hypothetical protein
MEREYFYCPLDDGEDFPGGTNCGGEDFGSRLKLDIHFCEAHFHTGPPARLAAAYPTTTPRLRAERHRELDAEFAEVLRALRPFIASEHPDFHGAPPTPHSCGWGMLGAAAGVGQGLPQARYAIWSQGTPIAWYLNDSTDEGWVFPEGEYYYYDRITAAHQKRVGAVLELVGEHPNVKVDYPDPWAAGTGEAQ